MGRGTEVDQDADLKQHALPVDSLYSDNLTSGVMARISKVSSEKKQPSYKRSAVLAAVVLVILVTSLTTYAASEYLEIRNEKGKVVIKTVKPQEPLPQSYFTELYAKYWEQANTTVKQGEMLAYYINDKVIQDYDGTQLRFTYKNDFVNYEDYVKEMKAKEAPILYEPEQLPQGYHYYSGQVVPAFPTREDVIYQELAEKLISEAEGVNVQEKMVSTLVPWTKSGSVTLIYKKDESYLYFMATKGIASEITQPEGAVVKQKTIQGQELVYVRDEGGKNPLNRIGWFDESTNIIYHIYDSHGSSLTEQDFVSMATSIIKQTTNS